MNLPECIHKVRHTDEINAMDTQYTDIQYTTAAEQQKEKVFKLHWNS